MRLDHSHKEPLVHLYIHTSELFVATRATGSFTQEATRALVISTQPLLVATRATVSLNPISLAQMSSKSCQKCKKNVTAARFPGISCVGCEKPYHWNCAEISDSTKESIVKNKLSWTCKTCKRRSTIFVPTLSTSSGSASTVGTSQQVGPSTTNSSELLNKINRLEELLNAAITRIDTLETQLSSKSSQLETVATEIQRLESTSAAVEKHLTDENLEIQNLPEESLDNPLTVAIQLSEAIGCPIADTDLKAIPVVDRKRLRLSFKSKAVRRNFLLSGKQFNRDRKRFLNRKIHVNEELSTSQRRLFEQAQLFKNTNNYKFLWFGASGQLLLKKDENSELHVIYSIDSLPNVAVLSEREGASH